MFRCNFFMSYEIHRETQLPFTSPSDARRRGRDAAVQGPYQENRIRIRSLECHFPYDFYAKYAIKIDVLSVLYGGS